jgi:hypothetical protein
MTDGDISHTETGASADGSLPFVERRINQDDRRKPTLRSFLQGGLIPRRRAGQRASDRYLPLDWHDPYLLVLALIMLALSVTDAFLTVRLLANGAYESNPLLGWVLNEHPQLFATVKMSLTGFGIVVLIALTRSRLLGVVSGRMLFQILTLAYMTLVGYELRLVRLFA